MDRGGRGGDGGGGGAGDLLSRIGKAALAIVAALLVVWVLFTFACSNTNFSLPGINLGGIGSGGNGGAVSLLGGGSTEVFSSKHTDDNDRKNWATVQDIDGNEYTTVVLIDPLNGKIDVNDLKERCKTYTWYQLIAGNSMGTNNPEKAYLYFPGNVKLDDLFSVASELSADGVYAARVLLPAEYQEYVNSVDPNNLYYNETTYFGPMAAR
jgi:hypothetical protein